MSASQQQEVVTYCQELLGLSWLAGCLHTKQLLPAHSSMALLVHRVLPKEPLRAMLSQ
jgi:hypothetical protein